MFEIITISLLLALISSVIFRGYIKRKNKQEEKNLRAEQVASDARRIQSEGIISELIEKQSLSDEKINASKNQFLQLEKKYYALFKVFKEGFEIVKQRQSEIEDRLTLGMKSHQEIKNKIDELSNANINLHEKLLHTTQTLGGEEESMRSSGAEMGTLMLDVKTRIDDLESNYQSFMKIKQETESKIEQLASQVLETENQFLNITQMNVMFGEKFSAVAKTLDEKDGLFKAHQKETEDVIQGLTGKINELGLHSEHLQKEFHEVSSQKNTMNDTIMGIHETINSLKNDFMHKVNSYHSEIVDQMSALRAKFDDQYLVNHQLGEKSRNIERQLKDISDTWEKLHEQQFTKYGELLDAIEGEKSRVQIMEEQFMGIEETEESVKKSVQDLLGEFSIVQRDIQSLKEEVNMKKREQRVVENKLDMIKKIINETEMELEEQRKEMLLPVNKMETNK